MIGLANCSVSQCDPFFLARCSQAQLMNTLQQYQLIHSVRRITIQKDKTFDKLDTHRAWEASQTCRSDERCVNMWGCWTDTRNCRPWTRPSKWHISRSARTIWLPPLQAQCRPYNWLWYHCCLSLLLFQISAFPARNEIVRIQLCHCHKETKLASFIHAAT